MNGTFDVDAAAAQALIRDLGLFPGMPAETVPVVRLGGLTNRVYRIGEGGSALCLRFPGKGTEEYINRKVELASARAAAAAGVSPDVIYADAQRGIMITRFIDRSVTMTPALFASTEGAAARAGLAFRKLHHSGAVFGFRFELFAMIDSYLGVLAGKSVAFPPGYHDGLKAAETVRAAIALHPAALAPCHCDPLAENFLDTGSRMWVVDFEYAGMNDPMWDLGDLSVEASFAPREDEAMLNAYFDGPPSDFDRARVVVYKAMSDLLWTLWGLIQLANENPADDFRAYADNRFRRCRDLMETADFAAHLAAIRRGP